MENSRESPRTSKADNEDKKRKMSDSNSPSPTRSDGSNHRLLARLLVDEILANLRDQTVVKTVADQFRLEMKRQGKGSNEAAATEGIDCCCCCCSQGGSESRCSEAEEGEEDTECCCCCCSKEVEKIKSLLDTIRADDDQVEKELRGRIECLTQSNSDLRKTLTSSQCSLECEKKEKSRMAEQLSCLQRKLASTAVEWQKSQQMERKLSAELESLAHSNTELKEAMKKCRCALECDAKEKLRLHETIKYMNGRLSNCVCANQKSKEFTKKLEQELQSTREELNGEQDSVDTCNKKLCEADNRIEQLSNNCAAIKTSNKELKLAVANQTEAIDKLLCEKRDLCSQIDSLKERLSATEHCQLLEKDLCNVASSEETKARHDAETYEGMWRSELEARLCLAKQVGQMKQCYMETKSRNELLCRKLNRLQLVKRHLEARICRSKQKILEQQRRVNKYMGDISVKLSSQQQLEQQKRQQLLKQKRRQCYKQQQLLQQCKQQLCTQQCKQQQQLQQCKQELCTQQCKQQQGQQQCKQCAQQQKQAGDDDYDRSDLCCSSGCSVCDEAEMSAASGDDSEAEQSMAHNKRDSKIVESLRKQLCEVQSELEEAEQQLLKEKDSRWRFEKENRHLASEIERLQTVECEMEKLECRIKKLMAERQQQVPRDRLEKELTEVEERSKCELQRSTTRLNCALVRQKEQLEQLRQDNEQQTCRMRQEHEKHVCQLQNRLTNQTRLYEAAANEKAELLDECMRYKKLYAEQVELRERLVGSLSDLDSFTEQRQSKQNEPCMGNTAGKRSFLDNSFHSISAGSAGCGGTAAAAAATSTPVAALFRSQTGRGCREADCTKDESFDMDRLSQRLQQAISGCLHGTVIVTEVKKTPDQSRGRRVQSERRKKGCGCDGPPICSEEHQKYISIMQKKYSL